MQLAMLAADFTPGEADQLRRAMAAWKRKGGLEPFQEKLIEPAWSARATTPSFAEAIFKQIEGFGEYGFPESHAASFALLVYVSAGSSATTPTAFLAALLNSLADGLLRRAAAGAGRARARRRGAAGGRHDQRLGLHAGAARDRCRRAPCRRRGRRRVAPSHRPGRTSPRCGWA